MWRRWSTMASRRSMRSSARRSIWCCSTATCRASAAFIEKLVNVFVADASALLERIEQSLAARDYGQLRSLLHAMKGSSASIGTDRLTSLCTSVGKLSDAQLRLQSTAVLRSLSDELAAARSELERHAQIRSRSTGG